MSPLTQTAIFSVPSTKENTEVTPTSSQIVIESTSTLFRNHEIEKGFNLLGLKISDLELNELQHGNIVSLETRRLSEIGSVLILAEALSSLHSVKNATFTDLPKVITESLNCSGIPVHIWSDDILGKCYLLLTVIDGKPAFKITSQK